MLQGLTLSSPNSDGSDPMGHMTCYSTFKLAHFFSFFSVPFFHKSKKLFTVLRFLCHASLRSRRLEVQNAIPTLLAPFQTSLVLFLTSLALFRNAARSTWQYSKPQDLNPPTLPGRPGSILDLKSWGTEYCQVWPGSIPNHRVFHTSAKVRMEQLIQQILLSNDLEGGLLLRITVTKNALDIFS